MLLTGQPQYRAIFDNAFEAITIVDSDGVILSANRAVERTFGYKPCELLGHNVGMLMPGRYARRQNRAAGGLRTNATHGRAVYGRRKDGSPLRIGLSVTEWQRDGETFFTDIMRDVSGDRAMAMERLQTTRALRDSEERFRLLQNEFAHLARVNDLGEMAAAIAHEINQPLSAIGNYLGGGIILVDGESADDALAAARAAMMLAAEQVMRAGGIIHGLREFVRKGEGIRQIVCADALVESAMALALIDIRIAGVNVEHRSAGADVMVNVDPVQIQQVLVNLLRNARDALATNPAGAERRLSIATRDRAGENVVEFLVMDNGPGIAADLRGRLFEPFITTKAHGMGMGLSVCRRLVEAHDGTISVDCAEAAGATFRILLPRAPIAN